ncbi:glucose-1-phosphate cytidylyltransferase [Hymenobacter sp. BT683]|uniref:Glucose-1-phosphate cytidylyltransferase n=1 Tax=Hymenobacter jeongseonensis TaxID=2791027 RepID=A0ABS0ID22_9BACT|nr:sugar phosphate nucleotidyltransferase [Hymenobacter jeongseonensis]MBF9236249.1 glucose-1-phosphate cytidylyltransferase [Hymenobacter jeongseonensis]
MKVILFCGGLGLRIRDYSPRTPKALVPIGRHPLLWHLMRYYAHYGHTEFILCLGHNADAFRRYFFRSDVQRATEAADLNITLVDTGLTNNIGQRLAAVKRYVQDDEVFMVNYADVLSDLPLPAMLTNFHRQGPVACFMAYQPTQSFHVVSLGADNHVKSISPIASAGLWVNAGFMVLRPEIFDYLRPGEELVEQPFQRLIVDNKLMAYRYNGFWASMDTLKDKLALDELHSQGCPPWEVWRHAAAPAAHSTPVLQTVC